MLTKSIFFRLTEAEYNLLDDYCKRENKSKSLVLRQLIRKIGEKKKRQVLKEVFEDSSDLE